MVEPEGCTFLMSVFAGVGQEIEKNVVGRVTGVVGVVVRSLGPQ